VRRRTFTPLRDEVTELSLGTWGLSGEGYGAVSAAEADAVLDRAVQLGINLYETSDAYNRGEMLTRLGQRLASTPNAYVAVRVGIDRSDESQPKKNFDPAYLREAVAKAGEKLKRSRIDIVLLHNPSVSVVERGEATGTLEDLRRVGEIGAWGVSAGSREVAVAALESGTHVLSIAYNLFHSQDLHVVAAEVAMRGVAVLAHSILAYGLLVAHWGPERTFDEGDHRRQRWSPADLRKRVSQLGLLRNLVGGDVLTPRAAALRYVLSNTLVTSAILGPRTTAQLDQLVREAGKGPPYLSDKALTDLPSKLLAAGIHT